LPIRGKRKNKHVAEQKEEERVRRSRANFWHLCEGGLGSLPGCMWV
jgi:hypothetical protein